jgi:hypothetical protein
MKCGAQWYWYERGVQRGAFCQNEATKQTEALDGSRTWACDECAQRAIDAGARLVEA